MKYHLLFFVILALVTLPLSPAGAKPATNAETVAEMKNQIKELKHQLIDQKNSFEKRLAELESLVMKMSGEKPVSLPPEEASFEETLTTMRTEQDSAPDQLQKGSTLGAFVQSMNPDISVIVDTYYHNDDSDEGLHNTLAEMLGFGHSHSHGSGHSHAHLEDGFNLRHVELLFSADVDPYFRAWAIAAISENSSELEEAVIQTSNLPAGLQLQAGKFKSNFGRINAQHSHEWDFVDQPLIYELTLGGHGLTEKGVQLSWLTPLPFHLLCGFEALQGENDKMFQYVGGDELPDKDGPRLGLAWIKAGPALPEPHSMQIGLFGARGHHQEAHDGNSDGTYDHWFDGHSSFWGTDFVYKYNGRREHGAGNVIVQGEYFSRKKDLRVEQNDLNPALVGRDKVDRQDGYYLQAVYGFLPRWRAGLRWEEVGLTNETEFPPPTTPDADYDSSWRLAAMLDFTPSEFSRLRLQANRGVYEVEDGREDVWQVFVQWMISLGTHGAHKF